MDIIIGIYLLPTFQPKSSTVSTRRFLALQYRIYLPLGIAHLNLNQQTLKIGTRKSNFIRVFVYLRQKRNFRDVIISVGRYNYLRKLDLLNNIPSQKIYMYSVVIRSRSVLIDYKRKDFPRFS